MRLLLAVSLCFLMPLMAYASSSEWNETPQQKLRLISGAYEGEHATMGVEFELQPGWKLYWHTSGDVGLPTEVNWQRSTNIRSVDISWPVPERDVLMIDDTKGLESFVYHNHVVLPLTVTPEDQAADINAKMQVHYSVCKEICIPLIADLTLAISPGYQDPQMLSVIREFEAKTPQANGTKGMFVKTLGFFSTPQGEYSVQIEAASEQGFQNPDAIMTTEGPFHFSKPEVRYSNGKRNAVLRSVVTLLDPNTPLPVGSKVSILLHDQGQAVETVLPISALQMEAETDTLSFFTWITMIGFAVLGGLILNIMPCVLPVLSIKLFSVLKQHGKDTAYIRKSFILSALGILSSFLLLAVLACILKLAGHTVGWGFHFQNPLFLSALIVVLLVFAANLIGLWEMRLPAWLNRILPLAQRDSLSGAFFTGAFATLLATPCTAPFLGTAVSFALTRGTLEILVIFMAMGAGMAVPYLLFAALPGLVRFLPKPGQWMVRVKYVLAALILLTAGWLGWIVAHDIGLRSNTASEQEQFWQKFDPEAIPVLVAQGKTVFVDITADWCLTCKYNELRVLDRKTVQSALQQKNVVPMRADVTRPDADVMLYLKQHNRYGIPFNAVFGPGAPEGILLPELLSDEDVIKALNTAKK